MADQSRNAPCHCGSGQKFKLCHGATVLVPGADGGHYGKAAQEKGEYLHVLLPTRGTVTVETMNFIASIGWNGDAYAALGVNRATLLYMPRKPVAEARELLAEGVIRGTAIQPAAKHWVLWLDDDAAPRLKGTLVLCRASPPPASLTRAHFSRPASTSSPTM